MVYGKEFSLAQWGREHREGYVPSKNIYPWKCCNTVHFHSILSYHVDELNSEVAEGGAKNEMRGSNPGAPSL